MLSTKLCFLVVLATSALVLWEGAEAGKKVFGIDARERDWIDKGLDVVYDKKTFDASVNFGGEEVGFSSGTHYSDEERFWFIGGVCAAVLGCVLILGCICRCLCGGRRY